VLQLEEARARASQRVKGRHQPVAVIDIGSNSVRLVVYERIARSPTPLFNEKVLAGLGQASRVPVGSPTTRSRARSPR